VHAVDDAEQVDVDHPPPVGKAEVLHQGQWADTRVVADNVDGPEPVQRGTCERLDACRVRHVRVHRDRAELGGRLVHRLVLDVGDDDANARGGQRLGDAPADAGGAAGHDRDLALEVCQPTHRGRPPPPGCRMS
jgi:hypothetical protein